MVERNINVKSVNLISTKQVKLSKPTQTQPFDDAFTLSHADASLVREYVRTAIGAISDSLAIAERQGASRSLRDTLARYRSDASSLLDRLR